MTRIRERASTHVWPAMALWLMTQGACIGIDPDADPQDDGTWDPDPGKADGADADDEDPEPGEFEPLLALDGSHHTRTLTDPEVDCFWAAGYRHIVLGTQIPTVTREQLAVALRGGFTVDLYIYFYWNRSMEAQVQTALDIAADYPQVGRIWLDLEEDPGGRGSSALVTLIDRAIAAAGDFPIGIYTGKGFWFDAMRNTDLYRDIPLWYARYDNVPSLDTYQPGGSHAFGGWEAPIGKQWDDHSPGTCGRAVDKNVMIRNTQPEVFVDRTMPADESFPPGALTDLRPTDGILLTTDYARPTVRPNPNATSYHFEIDFWNGWEFRPYWHTNQTESAVTVFPTVRNTTYRWRIRAVNSSGEGPWSSWAWFDFGAVTDGPTTSDINP